jgi:hypothetical protein
MAFQEMSAAATWLAIAGLREAIRKLATRANRVKDLFTVVFSISSAKYNFLERHFRLNVATIV